jgi:hypothetical protein
MRWCEVESLLPFRSLTTCLVSGATMSRKTHFICRMLENAAGMFDKVPEKIFIVMANTKLYLMR